MCDKDYLLKFKIYDISWVTFVLELLLLLQYAFSISDLNDILYTFIISRTRECNANIDVPFTPHMHAKREITYGSY